MKRGPWEKNLSIFAETILFMTERTISEHAAQVTCELKAALLLYDSMAFFFF